jgi:hypothetical protein
MSVPFASKAATNPAAIMPSFCGKYSLRECGDVAGRLTLPGNSIPGILLMSAAAALTTDET